MKLIEIKNLNIGYEGKSVLRGMNLTINSRDYIGVIGPNGGGKTTFIKSLLGIISPIDGEIIKCKQDLTLGYLPQYSTADRTFPISVIDTVLSGLMKKKGLMGRYTKEDRIKAFETLSMCGIENLAKKNIAQLSGGQFQRVLLSRALMSNPDILILDEPTTYIDSKFEKELYELLDQLNQRIAIIMVSHDLSTICNHVKSIACVNGTFHYHPTNQITDKHIRLYECPVEFLSTKK